MLIKHALKVTGLFISLASSAVALAWEAPEWEAPEWAGDMDPIVALRGTINFVDHDQHDNAVQVGDNFTFNTYDPDESTTKLGWGAFVGGEWELSEDWRTQLGIGYDFVRAHELEGDYAIGGNPEFGGEYQYNLLHQRVDAEFKLLREWGAWLPFFTTSIGGAWNKTSDYREHPDGMGANNNLLEGETRGSFTYSVGAGVEREFGEHVRVGVGYLYTDAGQAVLESHEGDALKEEIIFNEIFFQLSVVM